MIELCGVEKSFGFGSVRVRAVRGVDLMVPKGQFVSIMGPSGSGKSTLLNLIGALDRPSAGSIRIDGRDISRLDDDSLTIFRRRCIGLVFQFFNLLPTLSAFDNVLLPVMIDRKPTRDDRQRARDLLARVDLSDRADHHPHELSGGEMQRIAIARALMLEPSLILADEPTGNLDSAMGASVLALLQDTCATVGMTVVMVTHDRAAAEVGDRVVVLRDGVLVDDRLTRAPLREALIGASPVSQREAP